MSIKVAEIKQTKPAPIPAKSRKSPWRLAILFALAAIASGILLTGVSAWFLGAVALAGLGPAAFTFNFHTPAAFVRLFALTKTACKYGERVVGHRAALLDQVRRRTGLFTAMALVPSTRATGWQFGNQDRLADYIDDVEDVDFARLRVGMPVLALTAGAAALVIATAWFASLALAPIAVLGLAIGLMHTWASSRVTRQWASVRSSRRTAGQQIGSALAALVPLKAERAFSSLLQEAFSLFSAAEANTLAQRCAFAFVDLLAGLAGPLAALSVLLAAWHAGHRDDALLYPAFVAFGWLAFGESVQTASRILQGHVRERAARAGLDDWRATADTESSSTSPAPLQTLVLDSIPRQAPDGRRLGDAMSLTLRAGQPTVLVGASGTGKTTLLKQIAGWLGADDGRYTSDGNILHTATRRALSYLGLHDAAILSDTVRANLFAPDATDDACWQAIEAVELRPRIETAGGLDAWITQDVLSLGEAQRLNLARALLSDAPLMLLDEPTEHLDSAQGLRILERVLHCSADRIVVYSSHNEQAAQDAVQITL